MPSDPPPSDRLGDFILVHQDEIIMAWVEFARSIWPGASPRPEDLRNNARGMLQAIAADMTTDQSPGEQKRKSEGQGDESPRLDGAALQHAKERLSSGFDILMVVAEFRALRASVMRIWQAAHPVTHAEEVNDLVRFHESIDQLVAISVEAHSARVEQGRRLFLGIIGHDLRQPLCSVRLLASALSRVGAGGDLSGIVGKIQGGVDAMDALVRDLLDLSGAQWGKPMMLYQAPLDLGELTREVMARVKAAHQEKSFEVVIEGDLHGEWDGHRLRQMLVNLLESTARLGSREATAALVVRGVGDAVELTLRSPGQPVPKELLGLLFEPAWRSSVSGPGDDAGGMGLGLLVCREIVRAHHGSIGVELSGKGATVFGIRLPRVTQVAGEG